MLYTDRVSRLREAATLVVYGRCLACTGAELGCTSVQPYADYGFKYVFNMVDVYSSYSWQMVAKTEAATHAVEFVERVLGAIKERWGYSGVAEIKSDNGSSFETTVFAELLQGLCDTGILVSQACHGRSHKNHFPAT
jgi:hypothetical protein